MQNQNMAGDLIFQAGNGGSNGKGGDLHIGPGTYSAGNVIQTVTQLNANQFMSFLIPIILEHPELSDEKKKTIVEKLKSGLNTIKNIAELAKLIFDVIGSVN